MIDNAMNSATSKNIDFQRTPGTHRPYSVFLGVLSSLIVLPVLLVGFFNVLVDPYYVFGSPDIAGINEVRPFYEFQVTKAKPYQVRRMSPYGVFLGSSRAEVGLSPSHPAVGGLRHSISLNPQVRVTKRCLLLYTRKRSLSRFNFPSLD